MCVYRPPPIASAESWDPSGDSINDALGIFSLPIIKNWLYYVFCSITYSLNVILLVSMVCLSNLLFWKS
jgi:hypothetical protein